MTEHIKQGALCGEKVKYPDGIGYCIWYPLGAEDDMGICFDFPDDDIDDLIALLQKLKLAKARIYEDKDE